MLPRALILLLWRTLAVGCIVLALIGVVLPVLPTIPFLLVAAWAGGRGWPALEQWLLNHPKHGEAIRHWRDHRAVPRRAKWAAIAMMVAGAAAIAALPLPMWAKLAVPAVMAVVAVWLWRRPEV